MSKMVSKFALAAGLVFAMALLFPALTAAVAAMTLPVSVAPILEP